MVKDIKNILDGLKTNDQKKSFDKIVNIVIEVIKNNTNILLKNKDLYVKDNIIKIKTSSNIRFLILLNLKKINKEISSLLPNNIFFIEL